MAELLVPQHAIRVTTYEDFSQFVRQFAAGLVRFLLIVGGPGISKSQGVRRAVGNREHLYLETHATAFGMYQELFKHRGRPVIIDDLDHLYRDCACVRLLKSLCNTDALRRLRWPSRHPDIIRGAVPAVFDTNSPVCLIANEWRTLNPNVQAIEDRAIIVHFTPSVGELHVRVREWFTDEEVYLFIEEHLPYITRHSMRHYERGAELRKLFPERWKDLLLIAMGLDEKVRVIRQLVTAQQYASDAERIAAFESAGHGGRATFYRWKRRLGIT